MALTMVRSGPTKGENREPRDRVGKLPGVGRVGGGTAGSPKVLWLVCRIYSHGRVC